LGLLATNGTGPINGMFCKAGTLSGDVFSISNATIYRGTTSLGAIAGTGVASWAGGFGELLVTRGTVMRRYNGALSNVAFPRHGQRPGGVLHRLAVRRGKGRHVGQVLLVRPARRNSWDALDFATAEREPDSLLDIMNLGDNIWLFGQQTIESWAHTGDADLPFSRIEQVAFDQGIMDTGCVCRRRQQPVLHRLEAGCLSHRRGSRTDQRQRDRGADRGLDHGPLFTFWMEGGHEMVAIRLDTETLLYDCSTQEWCEFQTEQGHWIVAHAAMSGKTAYLGHQTTGELMGWSEWDDMGVELERRLTFAQQLDEPGSHRHDPRSGRTPGRLRFSPGREPTRASN
jgi:hypothetical protein